METKEYELKVANDIFKIKGYWLDQIADFNKTVDYPLVILYPGGGFTFHSQREEEPIALKFNSIGMHVVVVDYKLIGDNGPVFPEVLHLTSMNHFESPHSSLFLQTKLLVRVSSDSFDSIMLFLIP